MVVRLAVLVLGLVLAGGPASAVAQQLCDDGSARLVARAYTLALPMARQGDEFVRFAEAQKTAFDRDGAATRCMTVLGAVFRQEGLRLTLEVQQGRGVSRMFGGKLPNASVDLARQADAVRGANAQNDLAMAEDLLWLANVLPPLVNGDQAPYRAQDTSSRRTAQHVISTLASCVTPACRQTERLIAAAVRGAAPAAEAIIVSWATGNFPMCATAQGACPMADATPAGIPCWCQFPRSGIATGEARQSP